MRGVRAAVVVSATLLVFLALGQHTEGKLLTDTGSGDSRPDSERYCNS